MDVDCRWGDCGATGTGTGTITWQSSGRDHGVESRENGGRIHDGHPMGMGGGGGGAWNRPCLLACLLTGKKHKRIKMSERIF
jgi:hypothetical protein